MFGQILKKIYIYYIILTWKVTYQWSYVKSETEAEPTSKILHLRSEDIVNVLDSDTSNV